VTNAKHNVKMMTRLEYDSYHEYKDVLVLFNQEDLLITYFKFITVCRWIFYNSEATAEIRL